MGVAGLIAVRMADGDAVAVAAEPACLGHGAAAGGEDRGSHRSRPVYALVLAAPSPLEAGAEASAGQRLDVGGRRLGAALDDLGHRLCHDRLRDDLPARLLAVLAGDKSRHLMVARHRLLAHDGIRRVPLVVVYILHFREIIFFIGGFLHRRHRKLRFRHCDDNLVARMKDRALGKSLVQSQHVRHVEPVAVRDDRQGISRLHLVDGILGRLLGHHLDSLVGGRDLIRRDIGLRDLHLLGEIHIPQAVLRHLCQIVLFLSGVLHILLGHRLRDDVLHRMAHIEIADARAGPRDRRDACGLRLLHGLLRLLPGDVHGVDVQLPLRVGHDADLELIFCIVPVLGRVQHVHHVLVAAQSHCKFVDLQLISLFLRGRHHVLKLLVNGLRQRLRVHGASEYLRHLVKLVFHVRQHQPFCLPGNPGPRLQKGVFHHAGVAHGADDLSLQRHLVIAVPIPEAASQKGHAHQHAAAGEHHGFHKGQF